MTPNINRSEGAQLPPFTFTQKTGTTLTVIAGLALTGIGIVGMLAHYYPNGALGLLGNMGGLHVAQGLTTGGVVLMMIGGHYSVQWYRRSPTKQDQEETSTDDPNAKHEAPSIDPIFPDGKTAGSTPSQPQGKGGTQPPSQGSGQTATGNNETSTRSSSGTGLPAGGPNNNNNVSF